MKNKLRTLIRFVSIISTSLFGEVPATSTLKNEIEYVTQAEASYADPESVDFQCNIVNHSKNAMVVVLMGGMHRIVLIGPDGKPVRPYPYHPSGRTSYSYAIRCYPSGGRCEQGMRLSGLFPFPLVGEYRCILTRRVYQWDSPDVPDINNLLDKDYFGKPVEVTAPELRFRVEKPTSSERPRSTVDPLNHIGEPGLEYNAMGTKKFPARGEGHYKSIQPPEAELRIQKNEPPLPPSNNLLQPTKHEAASSPQNIPKFESGRDNIASAPWDIIAVLIVAAIGLLWLLLKRRAK